jgi:hypothetical protein
MTETISEPRIATVVDPLSHAHLTAIALLSPEDFLAAQGVVSDLDAYFDYQDWLDSRDGFHMGFAAAGVDAKKVPVALATFLAWCRLTKTTPSERALDDFALMLRILRKPPPPVARAEVRNDEFEAHARTVEAFAAHANFEQWARHRVATRQGLAARDARIESVSVNLDDFVAWSQCVGEVTSEATLDDYAKLVLEFLVQDPTA